MTRYTNRARPQTERSIVVRGAANQLPTWSSSKIATAANPPANQGDEQTVCPRHVLQIHRVHRRYAGYEAQVLDTDRYKTKEADIDQLRADGRCAKTGSLRAWGHNKRGAIVTGERWPSLSTGAALTKKAERTRPFPHSEKVMG